MFVGRMLLKVLLRSNIRRQGNSPNSFDTVMQSSTLRNAPTLLSKPELFGVNQAIGQLVDIQSSRAHFI